MVPLKSCATIGLVCGYFVLVLSSYYCVENVTRIVNGENIGFLGLPMNLAWILMTVAFIVSIKKKNLKLAKVYKNFFVTNFIVTVTIEMIIIHLEANDNVQIYETSVNIWIFTAIVLGVALAVLAVTIWILTQVIRYIEGEDEAGETTAVFKQIQ